MNSMEINKIAAAVLTAGIAFLGLNIVADNAVSPKRYAHSAIKIKGEDAAPAGASASAPAAKKLPPIGPLLVSAKIADGEALTHKVCIACHNFQEGQANKVGPLLYGVVGRTQASAAGYSYSTALKGKSGKWTYEQLNEWLAKPSAYAPGTKMAYAGIEDDQIRADVIDYLHTLAHDPEPLPTAGATPAAPAAAPPGKG